MMTPQNDERFREIEDLVQRDAERALQAFRRGDFAARLRARLEAGEKKAHGQAFRRRILIPAFGFVFLSAIGLTLILLRYPRFSAPAPSGFQAVVEMLRRPDPFVLPLEDIPPVVREGEREADGWIIGRSLARLADLPKEEGPDFPSREAGASGPRFSRSDRARILFQEKAIERVLMMI